jgi:hypothetical protein
MLDEPLFKIEFADVRIDRRLSNAEIEKALAEIEHLSFIPIPLSDWTIAPIDSTNREWHRQKLPDERFRSILKIDMKRKVIFVRAILVREDNTYSTIVRKFYLDEAE